MKTAQALLGGFGLAILAAACTPGTGGKAFQLKRIGDYALVENPSSWEKSLELNVGVNPEQIAALGAAGLRRAVLLPDPGNGSLAGNIVFSSSIASPSAWILTGWTAEDLKKQASEQPGMLSKSRFPANSWRPFGTSVEPPWFPLGSGMANSSFT